MKLSERPVNQTCVVPPRPPNRFGATLETAYQQTFGANAIVPHPGDDSRWYLLWHAGKIFRLDYDGSQFSNQFEYLNIRDRTAAFYDGTVFAGMGLVDLEFDPDFASNGQACVYYGSAADGAAPPLEQRLSRFTLRANGQTLNPASEEILISTPQTTSQHKGGDLGFGPDGYLYLSVGDDEVSANGQDTGTLAGSLLRLDVHGGTPYAIPPDNPFVAGGGRPEIYAWGFRNPWRWNFDLDTDQLWLGDVGSDRWEEINIVERGGNYGWNTTEGFDCFQNLPCDATGLQPPLAQFPNVGAAAIIGGYVYRGSALPALQGAYVFADGPKGIVYALLEDDNGGWQYEVVLDTGAFVNSFAQGNDGELYLVTQGPGQVLKLVPEPPQTQDNFPQLLSATGCVDVNDPRLPADGLIPYGVASPLWSDGAHKTRFIAMPDWLVPGARIALAPDGDFDFPIGTVLVKNFALDDTLVETRLMMRHDDGEWGGYSYEWNAAQTDATLLEGGKTVQVGTQSWTFPNRAECFQCHTEAAGRSLGLEVLQQNSGFYYDSTDTAANQLDTLIHIGLFNGPVASSDQQPALASPFDAEAGIVARARSYLHANCAMCHRPQGPARGPEDFRYQLASVDIGALNVAPTVGNFGIQSALLLAPGHPERSIMSYRMHQRGSTSGQMPPIGTALVDDAGAATVDAWIRSGLDLGVADTDGDQFADNVDNCSAVANPTQADSDEDGFGDRCDADLNNDCVINSVDLGLFRAEYFGSNPVADFNSDGAVNALDLGILRQAYFGAPGPAGEATCLAR